jgi:ribosomal protein L11 methyltransferase
MDYVQVDITMQDVAADCGVLISLLAEEGFESFAEPSESHLQGWIPKNLFQEEKIETLLRNYLPVNEYHYSVIPAKNWNAEWESSFQPVEVENTFYLRAGFHAEKPGLINLLVEPRMSFGTGHHPTTVLMLKCLIRLRPQLMHSKVLDMGCGTGVLSVAAEKFGAQQVLAVDIDEWGYRNTVENIEANDCKHIHVLMGDIDVVPGEQYQIILANINLNVLRRHLPEYASRLAPGGFLCLSGFFETDVPALEEECKKFSLQVVDKNLQDSWACLCVSKA